MQISSQIESSLWGTQNVLNKDWGACFYLFEADPQIFWQPSYVKAEGKSLSSFLSSPKLHIRYVCVTLVYLLYFSMISVAFMWHLCDMIAYMWHIRDETYSICWICYYVRNICDLYLGLVRVHSQLVAISHSLHIVCIFSFLCIACIWFACIWFRANIFKIFSSEVNKCYLYTEMNWCLQLY